VRAGVADNRAAHREEAAFFVERQFGLDDLIAALIIAEERFGALARPLDRAAEALGGPHHQPEFRKERVAGAEIAADIATFHANA
jgi:hypothetical protein